MAPSIKIDKDVLIRNKFWILLGLSVPLVLVGLAVDFTSVAAENKVFKEKIITELKKVGGRWDDPIYNASHIEVAEKALKESQENENRAWKAAYDPQAPLFTWPTKVEDEFNFTTGLFAVDIKVDRSKTGKINYADIPPDDPTKNLLHGQITEKYRDFIQVADRTGKTHKVYRSPVKSMKITQTDKEGAPLLFDRLTNQDYVIVSYERGKYFGDPLTDSEQTTFRNSYLSQIHPILKQVQPINQKGEGVVELRDWAYREGTQPEDYPKPGRFIQFLDVPWTTSRDISEAAWISQEDLWVQKEVYRLIRQANDYVSQFKGKGGEEKNKDYVFTNPYWELKIKWLGGEKISMTLSNQLPRRQKLDLEFLVKTSKNLAAEKVFVAGTPLEPKGSEKSSITIAKDLPKGFNRTGIYDVEQVLTWETAAIRRIDRVAMAQVGEGAAGQFSTKESLIKGKFPKFGFPPPGGPQSVLGAGMTVAHRFYGDPLKPHRAEPKKDEDPNAPMDPAEVKPAPTADDSLPHGIPKNRYQEVTKQLRRIPVAVVLIAEQSHVDRVQASFNNSKLRFLTTQVLVAHYSGSVRPSFGPETTPAEKQPAFGLGEGGFRPPTATSPAAAAGDDQDNNVEMVLYGFMTLYERFPPKIHEAPKDNVMPK